MIKNKIIFKNVSELTDKEIMGINEACTREFHEPFKKSVKSESSKRLLFLLKDNSNILAMGQLITVEPVIFMGETFSVLGIGGIVSNIKGKGYGKKIMLAIKQYLIKSHKSGIGFCGSFNRPFYEKCGFSVDPSLTQKFVYYQGKKRILNPHNEVVVYFDQDRSFMEKVLASPKEEVFLPRPPNW